MSDKVGFHAGAGGDFFFFLSPPGANRGDSRAAPGNYRLTVTKHGDWYMVRSISTGLLFILIGVLGDFLVKHILNGVGSQ